MKKSTPPSSGLWLQYVEDVLSGSAVVGEYIIKAVETFVDDLNREAPFRWKFKKEKAEKAVDKKEEKGKPGREPYERAAAMIKKGFPDDKISRMVGLPESEISLIRNMAR